MVRHKMLHNLFQALDVEWTTEFEQFGLIKVVGFRRLRIQEPSLNGCQRYFAGDRSRLD